MASNSAAAPHALAACICLAIAQTKPESSRAIAAVITVFSLPAWASSHVRRFKLQAQKFYCFRSSGSEWPPLGRAGGTIIKTTVDHALMRGLVAAGPVMRRGASSV
jgi:hypothetical protein